MASSALLTRPAGRYSHRGSSNAPSSEEDLPGPAKQRIRAVTFGQTESTSGKGSPESFAPGSQQTTVAKSSGVTIHNRRPEAFRAGSVRVSPFLARLAIT